MNTKTAVLYAGRRAISASALAGGLLALILALAASPAEAAVTARIQAGTLRVAGDAAGGKLALRLQGGSPSILDVDVGDDGSAEFSFNRNAFTAIDVTAG